MKYTSKEIPMAKSFGRLKNAIERLRPYKGEFNKISIEGVTSLYIATDILETLENTKKFLGEYMKWQKDPFESENDSKSIYNDIMSLALATMKSAPSLGNIDPRRLLDLDLLEGQILDNFIELWMILTFCVEDRKSYPIDVICNIVADQMYRVNEILEDALAIFGESGVGAFMNETQPDVDCRFLDRNISKDANGSLKFHLHDEVVFMTDEEIEEENRRKQKLEDERKERERVEEARKESIAKIGIVLKAYNKQLEINNIKTFRFSDEKLDHLKNPHSVIDCVKGISLYKFLLEMSNAVRYMPGEEADDFDRIMGSFQELDQDILKYNNNMLIFVNSQFKLTHDDVYYALGFLQDSGRKIVAQYVDTKEYIDNLGETPSIPKTISIFAE